jgi:hypothetical protein
LHYRNNGNDGKEKHTVDLHVKLTGYWITAEGHFHQWVPGQLERPHMGLHRYLQMLQRYLQMLQRYLQMLQAFLEPTDCRQEIFSELNRLLELWAPCDRFGGSSLLQDQSSLKGSQFHDGCQARVR